MMRQQMCSTSKWDQFFYRSMRYINTTKPDKRSGCIQKKRSHNAWKFRLDAAI